jgi:hypothetical protein
VLTGSRMSIQRAALWLLTACAVVLAAADPSWKGKPTPDWTEEDARQILTNSPWAKPVKGMISRRQTEDERREGGNMGQEHGVGYDGIDDKRAAPQLPSSILDVLKPGDNTVHASTQFVPLMLRWESALPVRVAELKSRILEPPTLEGEGYNLAVYGVPGAGFKGDPSRLGEPLKKQAFLRREGKRDVRPTSVEVFQGNDGLVIVYLFPLSAEITTSDQRIEFVAQIGRVGIAQSFDLAEMQFQGRLEL